MAKMEGNVCAVPDAGIEVTAFGSILSRSHKEHDSLKIQKCLPVK